jgi:hypothetical protein
MVWIAGGAFVYGESNNYDPSALVRADAVVVTINYGSARSGSSPTRHWPHAAARRATTA